MRRKVNRVGTNTLTVSLPSKWAREQGIKAGDELEIEDSHGVLNISTDKRPQRREEFHMEITSEELSDSRYLVSHLDSLYIIGFDKMHFKLPAKEQVILIQQLVRTRYLGYEISSFEGNTCIVEKIADVTEEKFENVIRRMFAITSQMSLDFLTDLQIGFFDNLELHKGQSSLMDVYTNYCLRVVSNQASKESYAMWSIVLRVSQIYHILFYCYERIPSYKILKFERKTLNMFQDFSNLFADVQKLFHKYDIAMTRKIHKNYAKSFKPHIYDSLHSSKDAELFFIFHLAKAARQILYLTNFITILHTSKKLSA